MEFHEKTLELNITHELLSLADCWYWFLTDIPLWRYWRPRYRLPFLKHPRSTSGGFHITTEGKKDPTGNAGGGYDVRIKSGVGGNLLFIQYKKGELITNIPDRMSEFAKAPHEHFKFKINSTSTNQHFVLRDLAKGIGGAKGNAVVYAFPLIADMVELETHAGSLIRKTKFVSVPDIDIQAEFNKVEFKKGKEHNFRIGKFDINRCEVNFFFFFFSGIDRTPEIIADTIAINFRKTLLYYLNMVEVNYKEYNLSVEYIPEGLRQSFMQYIRYLFHYFEVSPFYFEVSPFNELSLLKVDELFLKWNSYDFSRNEFSEYESFPRDVEIMRAILKALNNFGEFIAKIEIRSDKLFFQEIPQYLPQIFVPIDNNGINISLEEPFVTDNLITFII